MALIGGENDPTRVDVFPLEGAPDCPAPATQFTQATSGSGLSGGLVEEVPILCGEAGVDYMCHKLEKGASEWTPVASGARLFEAAMVVYDDGGRILAIGGR